MIYNKNMKVSRDTKYSKELLVAITSLGHATNAELLSVLRSAFPKVSSTTVHRATARLFEHGKVFEAPVNNHGSMRYDATTTSHDHFICNGCDGIRNINVATDILPAISSALGDCKITGNLVIYGTCERCLKKKVTV